MKGYKLWDPISQKVFYSKSVIFRETKPSSATLQPERIEEKKDVIQLPATPKKVESRPLERQVEESSMSSTLEEEGEPDHELEPKPKLDLV